ncbi:MAG: hypothetical protein Q4E73_07460, partial [Lachnospiraceae bacterium]|nr:hypothetical protein [Lachnospiraceae bacterium]
MAIRRMFSKEVICTDVFLEMPLSAQALYFHFGMQADDDGFVGNPSTIKRMVGASNDDYKLLIAKEFIIPFQNGVVVIRHWKIHNAIRKDRYKETVYKEQKALINSGNDSAYIFSGLPCDNQTATKQQPTVDKWETQ